MGVLNICFSCICFPFTLHSNKFDVTHELSTIRVTDFIVLFIGACTAPINGLPNHTIRNIKLFFFLNSNVCIGTFLHDIYRLQFLLDMFSLRV